MKKLALAFLLTASAFAQAETPLDWSEPQPDVAIALVFTPPPNLELSFYLKNLSTHELTRLIQTDAACVLEVNGRFYSSGLSEGKSSYMPPGREFGPLKIDLGRFFPIPGLQIYSRENLTAYIQEDHVYLKLPKGPVTLRVYFNYDDHRDLTEVPRKPQESNVLIKSKEIHFENP